MKEKEFRKIIRQEIKSILNEEKENSLISNIVTKFYEFIIKNDFNSAVKYLKNNPELLKMAEKIKLQTRDIARKIANDKNIKDWLLNNDYEDIK